MQQRAKLFGLENLGGCENHCRHHRTRLRNVEGRMTNQWVETWLAEIESSSEERRLQLNTLQADQCLAKIAELEQKLVDVESLAAKEQILIEKYRQAESDRITKRIHWLAVSLEAFMREHDKAVGDKSLQLPHCQLKLRQQRDRIIIENAELLMPTASKHNLVRVIPESYQLHPCTAASNWHWGNTA